MSTPGAKFITMDLKDFYYGTPMEEYEYMRILLSSIPQQVIEKYGPKYIEENGWIYIKIKKGMFGLKQAG